jgi:hypothetical protein
LQCCLSEEKLYMAMKNHPSPSVSPCVSFLSSGMRSVFKMASVVFALAS